MTEIIKTERLRKKSRISKTIKEILDTALLNMEGGSITTDSNHERTLNLSVEGRFGKTQVGYNLREMLKEKLQEHKIDKICINGIEI